MHNENHNQDSKHLTFYAPAPGVFAIPKPPVMHRASLKYVDFRADEKDWAVPFLRMFGFSGKAIAMATGLSEGQVDYRLTKINRGRAIHERISSVTYRDGTSPVAKMVVAAVGRKVKSLLCEVVNQESLTGRQLKPRQISNGFAHTIGQEVVHQTVNV